VREGSKLAGCKNSQGGGASRGGGASSKGGPSREGAESKGKVKVNTWAVKEED
jgi:hypothetical protein